MWEKDGALGYGGNFLANSPEMKAFSSWRVPVDRRLEVTGCETFDFFEKLMKAMSSGP